PRLAHRGVNLLSRFPDLIICNSQAGQDTAIARGFPAEKTIIIPNGIDTDRFLPHGAARARVRAGWGVAAGERLVGIVGRFDVMKDHPTFLRAAALVARGEAKARFVCVGGGSETCQQELRALADALGLSEPLIWAGPRKDMTAVYNALDLFALSS